MSRKLRDAAVWGEGDRELLVQSARAAFRRVYKNHVNSADIDIVLGLARIGLSALETGAVPLESSADSHDPLTVT